MAVAFDAVTTAISNTTGTSITHTVGIGGANRALFVCIGVDGTAAVAPAVTYASATLTVIATNSATGRSMWTGRLIAPATGANTLAITGLGAGNSYMFVVASYTGVDQTTPNDTASVFNTAGATSFSTALASASGNAVLGWLCVNGTPTVTHGSGQTSRASVVATGGGALTILSEEISAAATVTCDISWSTSQAAAFICFDVNAAAVAASVVGGVFDSPIFGPGIIGSGVLR